MLDLSDFYHLPLLDEAVEGLVQDGSGLILVAGLDLRLSAGQSAEAVLPPSGRATVFRILMRRLLEERGGAILVAENRDAVRVPRRLASRIHFSAVSAAHSYASRIEEAARRFPGLLVVDRLTSETAEAALAAARQGLWVLSQMDTIFRGLDVAQAVEEMAADSTGLRWVVTVQREPTLCSACRQPLTDTAEQLAAVAARHPRLQLDLERMAGTTFFKKGTGCRQCGGDGWAGDVAVFDIACLEDKERSLFLERYLLHLAADGLLPLKMVLHVEAVRLHRTFELLAASEQAQAVANQSLQRRLVELETAHQVLQQRTSALLSLQAMSQALSGATQLEDLAYRVCSLTEELCQADRSILYYLPSGAEQARVLAAHGWRGFDVPAAIDGALLTASAPRRAPSTIQSCDGRWPPGITPVAPDVAGAYLRAGLRAELVAQDQSMGALVVHSTVRHAFAPNEIALLETLAHQAAVGLQRAGLIEQLRQKVAALEAAQVELAQKERLERELELAHQVQQRILPDEAPQIAGYAFAMHNEPARQVGGDFYDVLPLDEDHFALFMADVSDKGMAAALYMALACTLLRAEARRSLSPQEVLRRVNELLVQLGEPDMFVTIFYGVVDRKGQTLTYCRAGHDRPFLLRNDMAQPLDGTGMALGIFEKEMLILEEIVIPLEAGDRVVLYTDGLTDALSPDGLLFDSERLKTLFMAEAGRSPSAFCRAVFGGLRRFQGAAEQYDDMALLVLAVE